MSWYFEDERTPASEAVLERVASRGAVVPVLWRFEIANGFANAIRRKRIDKAYRDASLGDLAALDIAIDLDTESRAWSATLNLADRYGLTVYDSAYLELAIRRGLPLASLDKALRTAGQAEGLTVAGSAA